MPAARRAARRHASRRGARPGSPDRAGTRRGPDNSYFSLATRPLHVLVFLAPLIILYEIGARTLLGDAAGGIESIRAHERLAQALQVLGVAGQVLPWVVLVTILGVWHIIARDSWRIRPGVLAGMLAESVVGTLPLLVLAAALFGSSASSHGAAMAPTTATPQVAPDTGENVGTVSASSDALDGLSVPAKGVLSIGAGLYEELVFRMLLLAAIHLILHDFLGIRNAVAGGVAIAASAIAFALYHDATLDASGAVRTAFYAIAGVYFGLVCVLRGFGVVVGVHAAYDFIVLAVL
ncbi:MAG: CPBP family intramembrane metalloprotease [Phycisphaeraceae bacterium]|nr:CPBP family intramembrane metalloprotease [Phycisphaeraceae bacterium]